MLEVQKITVKCCGHSSQRPCKLMFPKGAPECHRSDEFLEQTKLNVKPLIDIWSFGAVCSEAAVWVVLGMSGLNMYRHQRKQEICERGTTQDGSCFHNGEVVLQTVKDMHQRLLTMGEIRPGDHVTKPVLDHMVRYMLHEDPDMRDDALKLWKNSKRILEEAEKKVEKLYQQIPPRDSYPVGGNSQDYGRIMPTTPPANSHEIGQASHDNTPHAHGPPPKNRPRHSSNNATPGWPPFPEQRLYRRSGTWHVGGNINSDIVSSSLDGNTSPLIGNQQPRASPPAEERPELSGTISNGTPQLLEEQRQYGNESMPFSSKGLSDEQQSARGFPSTETNADARLSYPQPLRQSIPISFRGNGTAIGTQFEKAPQHTKSASQSTGYKINQTIADITSDETSQIPPPQLATIPSMTNTPPAPTPFELAAPMPKPEKPYLSFEEAQKIRVGRGNLRPEHQDLLNALKNRDHVSSSIVFSSFFRV